MKRMKHYFCILLAAIFLFPGTAVICSAAALAPDAQAEQAEPVQFSTDFFEVGQETEVLVTGHAAEGLTYQWYVGGRRVLHEEASYTPAACELESFIKVEVYDGEEKLGEAQRYFSRLPVCYLETGNTTIPKDTYIDAQMKLQGNQQYSKAGQLYDGKIQIKGRGNTTWGAPKKPYKIKLNAKTDLFGMGKNKHWVLLANYYDPSSLRNKLALDMSGAMGLNYQQSVWVNVILDGACQGVYQLCEHVRVGSTRTDIFDWEGAAEDAAGEIAKKNGLSKEEKSKLEDQMVENLSWVTSDVVTLGGKTYTVSEYYTVPSADGGYIYEVDSHYDEISKFKTTQGLPVNINAPEYLKTNSEMFTAAQEYFQALEDAVYADDFCTVYQGKTVRYTDLIDLDSFVIGWLVNDIFSNIDYGRKSTFYYRDVGGKLFYGPVWDMDCSVDAPLASAQYYVFRTIKDAGRRFMFEMTRDPVFVERARTLYWEVRYGYLEDMLREGGLIDSCSAYLKEALKNNDRLWNNAFTADEDTLETKNWLKLRTIWLDKQFATNDSLYKALHAANYEAGMFAQAQSDPVSLSITQLPTKLRYACGEAPDLTGLTLTVTLRSGETQTVAPDSFYVSMVKKGTAENVFEGIAPTQGEKTVTLCYQNLRASFGIEVYSDTVATATALIDAIPETVTAADYGAISEARKYLDALPLTETVQVENLWKLTAAESAFDAIIETNRQNGNYVLNAYIDGIFCYGGSNVLVVDVIHHPALRAVVLINPSGGTSTYSASSEGVWVVSDGKVQTWTIFCVPRGAYNNIMAKGASTNTLRLELEAYENESTLVKSTAVPAVVTPEIEDGLYQYPAFAEMTAATSAAVTAVQAQCGDTVVEGTLTASSAGEKCWAFSIPLTLCGDNRISLRYTRNGQSFLYSKSESCYLRPQIEVPERTPVLVGVRIAVLPEKTAYHYKNTVNPRGLVLEELYDDGSTRRVTQGYTVAPQKLTKTGTQTVTVTYQAFEVTYNVTVTYSFLQQLIRIFLLGFLWY